MPWCRDIMRLLDNLQTPTSELASLETRTAFFTLIHSVWWPIKSPYGWQERLEA